MVSPPCAGSGQIRGWGLATLPGMGSHLAGLGSLAWAPADARRPALEIPRPLCEWKGS